MTRFLRLRVTIRDLILEKETTLGLMQNVPRIVAEVRYNTDRSDLNDGLN